MTAREALAAILIGAGVAFAILLAAFAQAVRA